MLKKILILKKENIPGDPNMTDCKIIIQEPFLMRGISKECTLERPNSKFGAFRGRKMTKTYTYTTKNTKMIIGWGCVIKAIMWDLIVNGRSV